MNILGILIENITTFTKEVIILVKVKVMLSREIKVVRNMGGNHTVSAQGINNNSQCFFYLENKKAKGDFDYEQLSETERKSTE